MNYTISEVSEIYHLPLLDLIFKAATIHRQNHNSSEVQLAVLLSIKTGQCVEDCAYCPQSARHHTEIDSHGLLSKEAVLEAAQKAQKAGASRFCMGAAFREVKDGKDFDSILEYVDEVNQLGLEVCTTLGMLNANQAKRLKDAGLSAYNHNLDTSEEFYEKIISTRSYKERLDTLQVLQQAKISVCSGGIVGMGESDEDRIELLHNLANLPSQPESVPINSLVAVEGTPLAEKKSVSPWLIVRMVATARILMPKSKVRLSAGRLQLSEEAQALCFLAGANSIFLGDKLLTTPNNCEQKDLQLLRSLGLRPSRIKEKLAHV